MDWRKLDYHLVICCLLMAFGSEKDPSVFSFSFPGKRRKPISSCPDNRKVAKLKIISSESHILDQLPVVWRYRLASALSSWWTPCFGFLHFCPSVLLLVYFQKIVNSSSPLCSPLWSQISVLWLFVDHSHSEKKTFSFCCCLSVNWPANELRTQIWFPYLEQKVSNEIKETLQYNQQRKSSFLVKYLREEGKSYGL